MAYIEKKITTHLVPLFIPALFVIAAWAQKTPVSLLSQRSAELTTLTAPGATPFHLKASVTVPDKPSIHGVLEEYWVSPRKWRRTIQVPTFAQTIIVNGDARFEKNDGKYFPVGMQEIASALVQPIPDTLQASLSHSKVKLDFYGGKIPRANICDSNVQNNLSFVVCFSGEPQSISSIQFPFYDVVFDDRQPFGNLYIARHLIVGEHEAIKWEAKVDELTALTQPDENLFSPAEVTPTEKQFQLFQVTEEDFRGHAGTLPEIKWPETPEPTSGVITILLSIDNEGFVAEAWPADNRYPEMAKSARDQVLKWSIRSAGGGGLRQLETWLTLPFQTKAPESPTQGNK